MAAELYNDWYFDGGRVYFRTTDVRIYQPGEYQKHNMYKIYEYFTAEGWTLNAIAGMLGNMMVESGCNPGCCESSSMDWDNPSTIINSSRGIGLTQWTPARKYYNWATSNGLDPKDGDSQCARIQYECDNNLQWSLNNLGNHTWQQYIHSTESPETLARVFVWAYERPSNPDVSQRQANARWVYDWLNSQPTPPTPPTPTDTDWIPGTDFAALALAYDPDITGVQIPYSQMDCIAFVNAVWGDIQVVSDHNWSLPNGTNTLWRRNMPGYPTETYPTTSPDNETPTPVLWYQDTIANCEALYGEIPPGTLLFHQISEAGPPAIPPQYAGDGIGNFAHVGIYCGDDEVMQSGGMDSGTIPGGGVHRSVYNSAAWNYCAFVVYVNPNEDSPSPDPGPYPLQTYMAVLCCTKKRKDVTRRVKRKF